MLHCRDYTYPVMKKYIPLFYFLFFLSSLAVGQVASNSYFTWDDFVDNFGVEIDSAESKYNNLVAHGLDGNALGRMDFVFLAMNKDILFELREVLLSQYQYNLEDIQQKESAWQLKGVTPEIPLTLSNISFWALDMLKRGYEFDAKFGDYNVSFNAKDQKYPDLKVQKEEEFFDKGVMEYNTGNLSGSIIAWSKVLAVNPSHQKAYYSRAIVKNELYAWKSALSDYDNAILIDPYFIDALLNRGSLKYENDDYEGAIQDYNRVIEYPEIRVRDKGVALFNRGNIKFTMKNKEGACEDWVESYKLGVVESLERTHQHCTSSTIKILPLERSNKIKKSINRK